MITGSNNGTYIQMGKDISSILKKYNADLEVIPSKGSVENLDALTGKNEKLRAKWAIVQKDALEYYNFLHFAKTGKELNQSVKTLLPLYNEHIHIFTKKGKKINFKKGSIFTVGVPSKISGSAITARLLERSYGISFKYRYVDYKTGFKYLQDDKIDIYIDVISLGTKKYQNLVGIDLVNLPQNKTMDKRYINTNFLKSNYPWLKKNVYGYKVQSILVTNRIDKKSNQMVGIFLKIILKEYKYLMNNGHLKWKESYKNKSMKLDNLHPIASKILKK